MKEILITSTVLILALLVLRRLFHKALSRRVQYALWGLVLARLLLPVTLPASSFSVLTATREVTQQVETQVNRPLYFYSIGQVSPAELERRDIALDSVPTRQSGGALVETKGPGQPWDSYLVRDPETNTVTRYANMTVGPWEILSAVWKVGMALMGAFFVLSNALFYLRLRKNRTPFVSQTPTARRVYTVPDGALPSPCLFGGAIYLTTAAAATPEALRHVLAHEETHARHLDPLWALLRCVCLSVYWFDPLVWVAAACSKNDCELACDEGALERLGEAERIPYGKTLLSLIPVRKSLADPLAVATTMTAGKRQLKERVTRIAQKPRRLVAAVMAVAALAGVVAACTFTGAQAQYAMPSPDEVSAVYIYSYGGYAGEGLRQLTDQDKETVLAALEGVDLSKPNKEDPKEYIGIHPWMFRLEKTDGSYVDFAASSPFYILDGRQCFDGEYAITDRIGKTWSSLWRKYKPVWDADRLPLQDLGADYALEQAKAEGCVVFENGDISSGQEVWDAFIEATEQKKEASVRLGSYYTLGDPSRYDPAYYEEIKDDYPAFYIEDLRFDGIQYTLQWLEDGEVVTKTYPFLLRYEGEAESPGATYQSYVRYVLTIDAVVTWEQLQWGLLSSQAGAYIDHHVVYTDLRYAHSKLESVKNYLTRYMFQYSIQVLDANEVTNQVDVCTTDLSFENLEAIRVLVEREYRDSAFLHFVDHTGTTIQLT